MPELGQSSPSTSPSAILGCRPRGRGRYYLPGICASHGVELALVGVTAVLTEQFGQIIEGLGVEIFGVNGATGGDGRAHLI